MNTTKFRVLTWNLNHRARQRSIPDWVPMAIGEQQPDIIVLTEYVCGKDHAKFGEALSAFGLEYLELSDEIKGHNQVLIASRFRLTRGLITPQLSHPAVAPNFLHVIADGGPDIFGFRMPTPLRKSDGCSKRTVWEWLNEAAHSNVHKPTVVIGDFNTAVGDSKTYCGDCLDILPDRDWQRVTPAGHSWTSGKPGGERSIDHAFLSHGLHATQARYVWDFVDRWPEAASKRVGMPDHAMLLVDVCPSNPDSQAQGEATAKTAFGCAVCRPEPAEAAWRASLGLEPRHKLVDEPHYTLRVRRCGICGQLYLSVFTELIDWQGGDDSQATVVMPISTEEEADLLTGEYLKEGRLIYDIGKDRPSIWMMCPRGADYYIRWGTGIPYLPYN